jgi:uncharacterized protein YigE (DUF2233 family)
MKHTRYIASILFMLLSVVCYGQGGGRNAAARMRYAGADYDVYRVGDKGRAVQLFWKDDSAHILKSMGRLKKYVERKRKKLLFATNAGMYTTTNGPMGLYIENGQTLKRIDLKKGPTTNFYMQPNGVYYTTASGGHIVASDDYARVTEKVKFATQSGPMLVVNGKINSTFTKGSKNINIRSGVGIDADGNVCFAISESFVNFYDFASFFKEQLHCSNALFLDGSISRIHLPQLNIADTGGSFGVMVGVVE